MRDTYVGSHVPKDGGGKGMREREREILSWIKRSVENNSQSQIFNIGDIRKR